MISLDLFPLAYLDPLTTHWLFGKKCLIFTSNYWRKRGKFYA